jgi:DNA polymerase elongation subunit (family B)
LNTILQIQSRNELLRSGSYAAIDTEYRQTNNKTRQYELFAAALVDSKGNVKAANEIDFATSRNPEKDLVIWIMNQILQYKLTLGWYSKGVKLAKDDGSFTGRDSDLKVIDDTCRYYNIPSIIAFDKRGIPYVRGYSYNPCNQDPHYSSKNRFDWYYHIDLYQVYKKPMVKNVIYHNKYRDLSLNSVSRALLNEGKLENLDGLQIQKLSKEKQLEYVTQDAALVMKLSMHNDFEILDLMNAISTITQLPFDIVCHTGISTWWNKIISDKIAKGECKFPTYKFGKRQYKGGRVIEPITGYYKDNPVYVLDVKSLYPTMMINNNISFETINCNCCFNKNEARISNEIEEIMKQDLSSNQLKKSTSYWICKDPYYRGIIPRLLEDYRARRFRELEIGNNVMQLALKNLINGVYGLFGSDFFAFSDYRVAELTTAFGRQILEYMQHIAEHVYGLTVIYGDTDSIFVTNVRNENDIKKFLAECSIVLEDVEIEISNIYAKTLIVKKKHYIGIPKDKVKEIEIKGLEGMKSDRPPWINQLQRQLVEDLRQDIDPTIKLKEAYIQMENGQVPIEQLSIRTTLNKAPEDYANDTYQRILAKQTNAEEGDVLKYYKSNTKGKAHANPAFISRSKYLNMLKTTFFEQLKVLGYDFLQDVVGTKSLADF